MICLPLQKKKKKKQTQNLSKNKLKIEQKTDEIWSQMPYCWATRSLKYDSTNHLLSKKGLRTSL